MEAGHLYRRISERYVNMTPNPVCPRVWDTSPFVPRAHGVRARKRAREYSEAETEVERMEVVCEPIAQVESKTEEQVTKEQRLVSKTDARIDLEGTNVKV